MGEKEEGVKISSASARITPAISLTWSSFEMLTPRGPADTGDIRTMLTDQSAMYSREDWRTSLCISGGPLSVPGADAQQPGLLLCLQGE